MPLEEKSAISRIKTSIIKDIFWCSKAKPYNHSAFGFELAVFYPNDMRNKMFLFRIPPPQVLFFYSLKKTWQKG